MTGRNDFPSLHGNFLPKKASLQHRYNFPTTNCLTHNILSVIFASNPNGKGLGKVEAEAFENTMPTEIYCYATIPPSIVSSSNFNKIDKDTAKLYVPKGTYSAYYLSDWGSIFNNIIEMD